MMGSAPGARVA